MTHLIKFGAVGALGFALQTAALFLFTHAAPHLSYLLATAAAVELAVLHNFVWHQRWTWRDRPSSSTAETVGRLVKFNMANGAISIAGNLFFMSILVGRLGLPITPANAISVAGCALFNFVLADRLAFVPTLAVEPSCG